MMSVAVAGEGRALLLSKGAPESILPRCSHTLLDGGAGAGGTGGAAAMTDDMRAALLKRMAAYGGWCVGVGVWRRRGVVRGVALSGGC